MFHFHVKMRYFFIKKMIFFQINFAGVRRSDGSGVPDSRHDVSRRDLRIRRSAPPQALRDDRLSLPQGPLLPGNWIRVGFFVFVLFCFVYYLLNNSQKIFEMKNDFSALFIFGGKHYENCWSQKMLIY